MLAVLAAGCHRAPVATPENLGGTEPEATAHQADASLTGPFARLEDAPEHVSGDPEEPAVWTTLGADDGPVIVALREVRSRWTSSACMVTLQTPEGFFLGDDFLCSAETSDESVGTDQVEITIDGERARVRFRTSYQLLGSAAVVQTYEIVCRLGQTLSCSPPPAIGGYD
jgi:hypothetical protein